MLITSAAVVEYRTGEVAPYPFSSSTYFRMRYFSQTSS